MSIRKRILIPMVFLTIGCCVTVFVSSIGLFSRQLNSAKYSKIDVAAMVAENEIDELKRKANIAAFGMANDLDLIMALLSNDRDEILSVSNALRAMAQIDYCTILDAEGNVLTRTHEPETYNDSLLHLNHVQQALMGERESYVAQGNVVRLGAFAGAPIFDHETEIIGAVSLGFRLDAQDFVNKLKELTRCEVSVFLYDERVSSTLINEDGTYVLGTRAPVSISDQVLAGDPHIGRAQMFGNNIITKYTPLYGANQEIVGMIFVGYDTSDDDYMILFFILSGALITLVVLAACIIIARFISGFVERRLENMMNEIRETDEYSLLMFDSTPMSCALWNADLQIINCNLAALRLFGVVNKEEFNTRFTELAPEFQPNGELSKKAICEKLKSAFKDKTIRFEWIHRLSGGELMPCEVTLVRVKHKDEHLVAGYTRDLREQKAHLFEIEQSQESLRLALDVAESASKTKSTFLANMSHEIRTPLNSIIGFSELAQDGDIAYKTRDYLRKILENAKWLLRIINDILDSSKIESGKLVLENIAFDLPDLLAHCQSAFFPKTMEKGISLFCSVDTSVGRKLIGDPVRLRQALMNLLSNAVKFTNSGSVKLIASEINSKETNITVNFEVIDSGIGMESGQIAKIFEPFMQADDSVTRRFGGTGLGLPITKNIIDLMGGSLKVESAVGAGSKFSFALTFNFADDSSDTSSNSKKFEDVEKPHFEGEVLICEDNNLNQQVVCEHLERVGLKTMVAQNGQEGVYMVTRRMHSGKKPYDLIFMDIHMPVMDGLEAATKIAGLGVDTPIVAMTANLMANEVELYKTSGMADCVGKPFTSQELWKCLIKFIPVVSYSPINKKAQSAEEEKTLKQLRMHFVKSNQNTYSDIVRASDSGDFELAHRLAHTLKGNAGQIGEKRLQAAAAAAEAMFLEGNPLAGNEEDGILNAELEAVLDELAPLLLIAAGASDRDVADAENASKIFEKLERLLRSNSTECMGMLEDIAAIPGAEELVRLVEDFEFEKALAELSKLKMET